MNLYLSAPDGEQVIIRLEKEGEVIDRAEFKALHEQAERFLPAIDDLLQKNKLSLDDISLITVNNTGTSFSALRLVISIANTLAYAKNIPLKGKKGKVLNFANHELVKPIYHKKPNITASKT